MDEAAQNITLDERQQLKAGLLKAQRHFESHLLSSEPVEDVLAVCGSSCGQSGIGHQRVFAVTNGNPNVPHAQDDTNRSP